MPSTCSIDGCDGVVLARTWCNKHYHRWKATGDALTPPRYGRRPTRRRPNHHGRSITRLDTPCREWWGGQWHWGHGRIRRGGRDRPLHAWIWEQINGPVPPGMLIMHRCDNPPCFRYDHLQLGTTADNQRDMAIKGRSRNRYTRAEERSGS